MMMSALLFIRVSTTEIDLEINVSEIAFRVPILQA